MKYQVVSRQTVAAFAVGIGVATGGMTLAQHTHTGKDAVTVTRLSQREIIEKIDGKTATATVEVVTFAPGQKDSPHRHTGPVFGYVLDGEYQHALDNEPITTFVAGETFYEPSGSVHRVAQNASDTETTRLLAVVLHGRDVKHATVGVKDRK